MMQHCKFALAYYDSISNGIFFPGWVSDNIDYGSVGIRFYPPLPYYFLAVSKMIFGNWFDAFWINLFLWMLVGAVGVYLFAKEWVSPFTAMVASIIYATMPYHLLQIFQYFLYAEFIALCILPFCFLSVTRICLYRRWIDTLLFTISYSLLILTHIPLSLIGSISLFFYVLVLIDYKNFIPTLKYLISSLCLSLGATSFYWLKVVTEIKWVAHNNTNFSEDLFGYTEWLFPISLSHHENDLITNNAGFFDVLILLNLLLLLPAIIYLIKSREKAISVKRVILALSVTGFLAFFMTSRLSSLVWQFVPLLQKVQFPWRWISVFSLLGILSFVISLGQLKTNYRNAKRFFIYPILIWSVSIIIFDITQIIGATDPIPRSDFEKNMKYLPSVQSQSQWWTVWTKAEAFENKEKLSIGNRAFTIKDWSLETREFIVDEGTEPELRIATFYYPYWKTEINNHPAEIYQDGNGLILLTIPNEKVKIKLYFDEPLVNRIALWLSLLIWTLLSLAILYFGKR